MTSPYQVNLQISAGMDFYQEFSLAEPDMSPLDITEMAFHSTIKKHASSVNANESTSGLSKQKYASFETGVVDGPAGIYFLKLTNIESEKLNEGKYVYSTVMSNQNNEFVEMNSGLIFVDRAFGIIKNEETDSNNNDGVEIEPPDPNAGGGEGSLPD